MVKDLSPGEITERIIQHLKQDPIVVADLTGRNPNVFYELAIRHASGRPLVHIMQSGEAVPFDLQGPETVFYDLSDLRSVVASKDLLIRQMRLAAEGAELATSASPDARPEWLVPEADPVQRSAHSTLTAQSGMRKRYQVFVSSTYEDLQAERQQVMHALLELDCIPAGMELFPAANESQWSLIQRVIAESDYYVLVLAGRYGSCGSDGMGYTEKEYRYATSVGKPIIAFLHKDPESIPVKYSEKTARGRAKLEAFRSLVTERLCKFWSGPADLRAVVSTSLFQLIRSDPAIGWLRADRMPQADAAVTALTLQRLVEELEGQLTRVRHLGQGEPQGRPVSTRMDLYLEATELIFYAVTAAKPGAPISSVAAKRYRHAPAGVWVEVTGYAHNRSLTGGTITTAIVRVQGLDSDRHQVGLQRDFDFPCYVEGRRSEPVHFRYWLHTDPALLAQLPTEVQCIITLIDMDGREHTSRLTAALRTDPPTFTVRLVEAYKPS
jgi:hypothetical protein